MQDGGYNREGQKDNFYQEPEGSFLNRVIPGEREKYVNYEVLRFKDRI